MSGHESGRAGLHCLPLYGCHSLHPLIACFLDTFPEVRVCASDLFGRRSAVVVECFDSEFLAEDIGKQETEIPP